MISPIRSGITLLGLIALMVLISLNPRAANRDAPIHSLKDSRIMTRNNLQRLRDERIRD
ncbi:MAG: hypothetical protein GWP23_04870 [Synechococcales cyanobacterium H12SWP_bin.12]|nr:hypothetical protein [Synechococcales cyanobacterium H12SWP_bin.12]